MTKVSDTLFTRAVASFVDPDNAFRKKLESKQGGTYAKDIVIKFGVDPTRPDIHLGHAVILKKLRAFQDLGCKVIFLVGDFTASIGDPTGKSKVRPELDQKEIERNMQTYLDQVGKILKTDSSVFAWIRNSDWFLSVTDISFSEKQLVTIEQDGNAVTVPANSFVGKAARYEEINRQKLFTEKVLNITFRTFLATLRKITHSQLVARDMFEIRIKSGEELFMHEMMYPVLQGIDSYAIHQIFGACDLEIGGSDQTFNMLMGRDVMKTNGLEPQAVMALELLEGTDGKEKMSKSLDNYIAITDEPFNMFGKVMSIPDTLMTRYFDLVTYSPADETKKLVADSQSGSLNPKEVKLRLAREIVAIYHGEEKAREAEASFESAFSSGEMPSNAPEARLEKGVFLADLLVREGIIASKSEFRRLIDAGAITKVPSSQPILGYDFKVGSDIDLKIGKKKFLKIRVK